MKTIPTTHTCAGALSILLLLISGCEEWKCGYGGPGCSDPGLNGTCDVLFVNQTTQSKVVYFDDTGDHAATVFSAQSKTPDLLDVKLIDKSNVELTAKAPGKGILIFDIEGWDTPPTRTLTLVNTVDDLPKEEREEYEKCMDYIKKYKTPDEDVKLPGEPSKAQ